MLPEYRALAALLKRAESDDTVADEAVHRSIALERQLVLLGVGGDGIFQFTPPRTHDKQLARELAKLAASMRRSFPLVWSNLYKQAKRRCVTDRQPGQAQRLLSIDRQRSLLDLGGNIDAALRDYYRCARYTLEFTSSFTDAFTLRAPDCQATLAGSQDVAVEGSAISAPPPGGPPGRPEGTGTTAAQSAGYSVPGEAGCGTGSIWSDPLTYTIMNVSPGALSFQPDVLWDDPGIVEVLNARVRSVALRPGAPLIQMTADGGGGWIVTPTNAFFGDAWRVAHQLEAAHDDSGRLWYMLGGWAAGGGDIVGTLALDRDLPYTEADQIAHMTGSLWLTATGTLHERTNLTLRHTPDPSLLSDG